MYDEKQEKNIPQLMHGSLKTRQDVQREHKHFLNSCYQRYPDIERLLVKHSFGVCGIPLEIYWDSCDEERSQNVLWALRQERFGITVKDKCCVFRTAEYAGNKIMDYMPKFLSGDKRTLSFPLRDLSQERMKTCVEDIFKFDPTWMRVAPSVAVMLAETMASNGLLPPPSLRYIELSGEMLDDRTERMIQDTFHVQTSNVYATKEIGPIGVSCGDGNLHIFSENVELQVIRDGKPVLDEEGDIYVTSLQNKAMPLVRMKTGDRGVLMSASCMCGQKSLALQLTGGRECSFVITPSGRRISALMLRSLAEYANEEMSHCLAHIQFRQTANDSMDVILGVKPAFSGWGEEAARVLRSQIQNQELQQMKWNFIFVDSYKSGESELEEKPFFTLCEEVKL